MGSDLHPEVALIVAWLRERFPELRSDVDEAVEQGLGPPGLHTLFGIYVLHEYLLPRLDGVVSDDGRLGEMFDLIERMARSTESDIRNVVEVTICESLGDDEARLNRAYGLMGAATRKLSDSIEAFLNRGPDFRWLGPADGPKPD